MQSAGRDRRVVGGPHIGLHELAGPPLATTRTAGNIFCWWGDSSTLEAKHVGKSAVRGCILLKDHQNRRPCAGQPIVITTLLADVVCRWCGGSRPPWCSSPLFLAIWTTRRWLDCSSLRRSSNRLPPCLALSVSSVVVPDLPGAPHHCPSPFSPMHAIGGRSMPAPQHVRQCSLIMSSWSHPWPR